MILACDVGLKRIGIAVLLNGVILPLEAILRRNRNQASRDLSGLLREKNIQVLVVGKPNESYADTNARIEHFIKLVDFKGEIVFINEDRSSIEAYENLEHLGRKNKQLAIKDGRLDSLSACRILERYYQQVLKKR
ncbi:Holliday junction DNA helicase RuvA [Helicobacter pylori]|uniref:Putative pre-16S rRNA nuclease n=1 Tax=Helicobacter pylori TaxID=210 RepID=A0A0J8GYA7_HELPX|nr:Holliday junction resolvase RuvX [Helicobacter pylori]KMT67787.1 Holliday junction resolvase [Helicobacter pylori]OLQ59515.1 Holliday junction DNA helicase RuvA [Helicobacter pylori]OLR48464.1 Holliday junction DNA helicase RuvA [Helicobacter pylori]WRB23384.1 Holliday junction resolvase RuvX [Helicobacter pylori]WRC70408.1 Holliday junction resolvase RuvX [Helicobacter pylori]